MPLSVVDIVTVPVRGGYFTDDQAALRALADHSFGADAAPLTAGFRKVREPGLAVSVLLLLDDGRVAHGDCATVQYAGTAGRGALLDPAAVSTGAERLVRERLVGSDLSSFRTPARALRRHTDGSVPSAAVRYGVSQALLDAVAQSHALTMAEVLREEYATGSDLEPVPLFAQSGDDRYANVDKMVLKGVGVLPHGLINNVETKLGCDGELLEEYVEWVRSRVLALGPSDYRPALHFDVYGTLGAAFDNDLRRVADYLLRLEAVAAPLRLRVEHPIDMGSREAQIVTYAALVGRLADRGSSVQVVVDEWCNTLADIQDFVAARAASMVHVKLPDLGGIDESVEALLHVRRAGLGAYCGGTCNETDRSGQVSAHVAMACAADQVLARPGMGVDEGLLVVGNEMARVSALAGRRG